MKYDIFISYRREGGYDTAKHINDLLVRDGYKVSFDIDTLRNGDFDAQLYKRIDQCKDFILIVDEHAFDRTIDPTFPPQKDWLRCELAYALQLGKNIIPVFLSGTSGFPEGLPDDVRPVVRKNGPEYNRYYFNDFYKQLCSRFIKSWSKKKKIGLILSVALSIIASLIVTYAWFGEEDIVYHDPFSPHTMDESELMGYAYHLLEEKRNDIPEGASAISHWQTLASSGDAEAQLYYGLSYVIGYNCEQDYDKALEYIQMSANQDFAIGHYVLSVCYDQGIGVKQDIAEAERLCKMAAEHGVVDAQRDYAVYCMVNKRQDKAAEWIQLAANDGDALAQYYLSYWMINKNYIDDGLACLRESANQGCELAQVSLANMYINGSVEWQNIDLGITMLINLVERDNPYAKYILAACYFNGKGVNQDLQVALNLLQESANLGYANAMIELAQSYFYGSLMTEKDLEKAFELFMKAAEQGYPMAYFWLGWIYENDMGGIINSLKAKYWYKKAEKQGVTKQTMQMQQQLNSMRATM
ncbi:MAG: SEL1-like repeat protein [Alistipes sp.]|nr:SEL1-like repeat protein [Alistipes sp.]